VTEISPKNVKTLALPAYVFRYLSNYLIIDRQMNNTFRALNDKTRREILELLHKRDMTAGEIAESFDISKPSISHHLDILKQAGLVDHVKEGQYIYYSLNMTVMDELFSWLMRFKVNGGKNGKTRTKTKK
jgi:ArsR family transcriptional regulator, arsenate/arsenite/antimonite-responsive transcriptional repressor